MSIEAMKTALGALDWAADHITPEKPINCDCPVCRASDVLRRAIDEAEKQEPVAEVDAWDDKVRVTFLPAAERMQNGEKLYTSPPQRQPLTEKEVSSAWDSSIRIASVEGNAIKHFARAIERKHGIGGEE
jgi:hypothetical protein